MSLKELKINGEKQPLRFYILEADIGQFTHSAMTSR